MTTEGVAFGEAERLLREGVFEDCRPVWYSSNYVYLARLCIPDGGTFAAVYKPLRGESPLWDFPDGLYRREVAAYRLSILLGWTFIPPTVVRDGPEGAGSLQLYIDHDQAAHFFVQRDDPELVPQLQRICVFDAVANNADRKGGHCLLDEDRHIWGIDHGLCFHEQYKLRSVIWDWAGEAIPGEWLEDLARAVAAIRRHDALAEQFTELLDAREVRAFISRTERLIEHGRFPVPGPQRHYPWPLV